MGKLQDVIGKLSAVASQQQMSLESGKLDRIKELLSSDRELSIQERAEVARLLKEVEGVFNDVFSVPGPVRDSYMEARKKYGDPTLTELVVDAIQRGSAERQAGNPFLVTPEKVEPAKIVPLKRGGVLIKLKSGNVQFGAAPESVKEAMTQGGAKWIVIDGPTIADWYTARSMGEPEFWMYYLYFVASKLAAPAQFVTTDDVAGHLNTILRTSYLGPQWGFKNSDIAPEYPKGEATPGFPDMAAELAHFQTSSIDRMRQIHTFENGAFARDGVRIQNLGGGQYRIFDQDAYVGDVDMKNYRPQRQPPVDKGRLYNPRFQAVRYRALFEGEPMAIPVTSSHGFDPSEGTSGHMLWNGGKVVLVDPPANIMDFLEANQIPADAIDGVMLTHVHADHDQGTLQALMSGRRIRLYTTPTIERMFVDKLKALSLGRFSEDDIRSLWDLHPLKLLTPISINGLRTFFYHTFHPNVALGFNILNQHSDPIFGYSGDTLNDPATVYPLVNPVLDANKQVVKKPVISSIERAQMITGLPLAALYAGGIAVHEQGTPPIHTPASVLKAAQRTAEMTNTGGQLLAYHVSESDAAKSGLKKWGSGIEEAIPLGQMLTWYPRSEQENLVRALQRIPAFERLGTDELQRIAAAGKIRSVDAGTKLFEEGTKGDNFFTIVDGAVSISKAGRLIAERSEGLVGEAALYGEERNATVTTSRPSTVLEFDSKQAADIIAKSGAGERLMRLRSMRKKYHEVLSRSSVLRELGGEIVDRLLLTADEQALPSGSQLIRQGGKDKDVYFIADGTAEVTQRVKGLSLRLGAGNFVGEMALINRSPRNATVTAKTELKLLKFPRREIEGLMDAAPTLRLRLMALSAERGLNVSGPDQEGAGSQGSGIAGLGRFPAAGWFAKRMAGSGEPLSSLLSRSIDGWRALPPRTKVGVYREVQRVSRILGQPLEQHPARMMEVASGYLARTAAPSVPFRTSPTLALGMSAAKAFGI